ncbi:hypothetical protein ACP70R_023577 [Stipagrostis hirtigluma subsp. patula]
MASAKGSKLFLVLSSLFLQCFLCFAAPKRKRSIPPFLRFFIWLAYLGSDAVAVYALATLFSRQQKAGRDSSRILDVLWAPVLLLHLSSLCVLQVMVGILKCIEPTSLKSASIYSLVSQTLDDGEIAAADEVRTLESYILQAKRYFETQKPYRLSAIVLTFATIGLFHTSHKEGYNDSDVKVTYTLLCCTAALQLFGVFSISNYVLHPKDVAFKEGEEDPYPWSDRVAQYNLIASFVRETTPTKLLMLASFLGCKDYVQPALVKAGWTDYIQGTSTYWMFNDRRGQLTMQQERCSQELCRTLQGPFDEVILKWHLATDICFYEGAAADHHHETATRCREISNYMLSLLVAHPDMLMAGTRPAVFSNACKNLQKMFKGTELPTDEGDLTREIHRKAQLLQDATAIEAFIQPASKLASQLLAMGSKKRWKVMQGVWVEMLCFSASRCRGYLHAKSLGMGGEYLTYVWRTWAWRVWQRGSRDPMLFGKQKKQLEPKAQSSAFRDRRIQRKKQQLLLIMLLRRLSLRMTLSEKRWSLIMTMIASLVWFSAIAAL